MHVSIKIIAHEKYPPCMKLENNVKCPMRAHRFTESITQTDENETKRMKLESKVDPPSEMRWSSQTASMHMRVCV